MHLSALTVPLMNGLFTKTLVVMKLTAIFLLAASLQVTAAGHAQTVTISEKNVSLQKVFREIKKQTGYDFWYESDLLKKTGKTDVDFKNVPLTEALETCLRNQPLTWRIVGKVIVIKEREAPPTNIPLPAPVPNITVKGKVVDRNGDPIVGASVMLKGSKKGVSTNKDGTFTVTVPQGSILVITCVGYEPRELPVKDGDNLNIRMTTSSTSMNEMVVTGIFNRPRQNFTGAATSFTAEDMARVTNSNVLNALRSLDPSLQLPENINLGSNPNALPEVVLRGGNSLVEPADAAKPNLFNYNNSPNTPLFILDGFETTLQRVNDLDINRIAKVDILKDAAATAIYGSRAANGVIVIETIRPQSGRLRVTYNGNLEVETPDLTGYDLLNAQEKLDLELKTGVFNDNFNYRDEELSYYYNTRLAAVRRGVNTDWLAQPLRTGIGQKHNLYVEGGGTDVQYGIGATYSDRSGVMKGSSRQNINANTFLSYRYKGFTFRNDFSIAYNKSINSPYGNFMQYTQLNPYWSPYDSAGNYSIYLESVYNNTGGLLSNFNTFNNLNGQAAGRPLNPLYNATLNTVDQSTYQNITNSLFGQWQATQYLRLSGRLSYSRQSDESDVFLPAQHSSFANVPTFEKGTYTKGYGVRKRIEGMLTADINKKIGNHLIFGTLGVNMQQSDFTTTTFKVQGFPNPRLDQLALGNRFPDGSKPIGTEGISRLMGLVGNLSYSYNNRYLADFSYRLDGSSQFGTEKRFAPFWSAGIGWNLHNESFVRNLNGITRLKLRYSFGYTGSQNFSSFLGLPTSQYYTAQDYRGIIGTYLLGFGNPMLAWQKTYKSNFGIDITLFKRLDITANWYHETSEGSIGSVSTAPSTGFNSYTENIGDLVSKGWDLNARFNIISKPSSRNIWSVFVNAFHVKTKIEKVSNTLEQLNKLANSTTSTRPLTRYAVGQSTTAIWAMPSLGIDPSTGLEIYINSEGKLTTLYNARDQRVMGDTRSDVEGTIGTNVEINGIGLNIYLSFRVGGQAYNQTLVERVENVQFNLYNVDRRVSEQRWQKPGDHTFFKGLTNAGGVVTGPTFATSRFVQDNNLLACQNLSVYYRFSDKFNKRLHVQNTKVTFYTGDLFRLSSIKRERGLNYPFSHTYTLQLQTTF